MEIADLKNKKVLVMGLGFLGGGIATTKWFVRHGAKVTVTDLKTKKELADSVKEIENYVKEINPVRNSPPQMPFGRASAGRISNGVKFVLGRHRVKDFKNNEIVVVNPAVSRQSIFLKVAREHGAQIENEASLFFRFCKNPIIAVTGTRGKTTTVNWIYHFLKKKFPRAVLTGNSSDNPMLKALDKLDGKSPVVVELSSWHLEILPQARKAPHIAVITNIYADHLNRYKGIKNYASAKANIFKNQKCADFLILNKKNGWAKFFLSKKPKSKVLYFPVEIRVDKKVFIEKYGVHNFENLSAAVLAAKLAGVPWLKIKKAINSLPQVRFREEIVYEDNKLKIVNDSTATSPDATIVALERFSKENADIVLIAGGTDKKLQFSGWAKTVKKYVRPQNLYLLNGNATKKMLAVLKKAKYFKNSGPRLFEDLLKLLKSLMKFNLYNLHAFVYWHRVVLFSPGAASFEKFKNEFDRGEKFNLYFKTVVLQTKGGSRGSH